MTVNELMLVVAGLVVALALAHGRAAHWKAKYETLDKERSGGDGWEQEVRFLRRIVNKDAAEAVEY